MKPKFYDIVLVLFIATAGIFLLFAAIKVFHLG